MKITDWISERILFGLLIIGGFLGVAVMGMQISKATPDQLTFGKEALDVFGPIAGMIAAAIWKSDRTDKQNAETMTNLTAAVNSALASTPPAPDAPPTPPTPPAPPIAPAPTPPAAPPATVNIVVGDDGVSGGGGSGAPNPDTGETGTDPRVDATTGLPKGPIPYKDLKDVEANIWPDKP